MRPRADADPSVNQTSESAPRARAPGLELGVGTVNSVTIPVVVTRPILLGLGSVNHSAPSPPITMLVGLESVVGMANSVIVPADVIRATEAGGAPWRNQTLPSGP